MNEEKEVDDYSIFRTREHETLQSQGYFEEIKDGIEKQEEELNLNENAFNTLWIEEKEFANLKSIEM